MTDLQTYKAGRLKNCLQVLLKFLFLAYKNCSFIFSEEKHFLLIFDKGLRITGKK